LAEGKNQKKFNNAIFNNDYDPDNNASFKEKFITLHLYEKAFIQQSDSSLKSLLPDCPPTKTSCGEIADTDH